MSVFRVIYRQKDEGRRPAEDVEAADFVQRDPWIVFLDPTGPSLSIRADDVERVERLRLEPLEVAPRPSPPSDPPLG
jgi:hypothetical protein